MRALGYVRLSKSNGDGAGLATQRQAIRDACARRGWELTEVLEDDGKSSANLKRPGIQRALGRLDAGQADVLVVARLDRLSRSVLDFAQLMERARRNGWGIVALDLDIDTTTPAGEALVNVLMTFAQFERRLIGQRTKEALATKRAQGVQLGRPRVLSEPVRSRIRAERRAGATLTAIAARLNADAVPTAHGGKRWHASTVRGVLREA